MLACQVTAITESALQLPGICKKMSNSLLTHEKSLYTPTESALTVFLQGQSCFKFLPQHYFMFSGTMNGTEVPNFCINCFDS